MVRSVINGYPLRPLDSLEIIVVPRYHEIKSDVFGFGE